MSHPSVNRGYFRLRRPQSMTMKALLRLAFASLTALMLALAGIAVNSMNDASNQASRYT